MKRLLFLIPALMLTACGIDPHSGGIHIYPIETPAPTPTPALPAPTP